jgi:hypothetical protein
VNVVEFKNLQFKSRYGSGGWTITAFGHFRLRRNITAIKSEVRICGSARRTDGSFVLDRKAAIAAKIAFRHLRTRCNNELPVTLMALERD